jgi:hypothetical protein
MQVRHGVAQGLVVHLDRPVVALEGRGRLKDLQPEAAGFLRGQLGWLSDVSAAPDDDGVAKLPAGALQIGVAVAAGMDADAVLVLVWAALAHIGQPLPRRRSDQPAARSCSCCTPHAAVPDGQEPTASSLSIGGLTPCMPCSFGLLPTPGQRAASPRPPRSDLARGWPGRRERRGSHLKVTVPSSRRGEARPR